MRALFPPLVPKIDYTSYLKFSLPCTRSFTIISLWMCLVLLIGLLFRTQGARICLSMISTIQTICIPLCVIRSRAWFVEVVFQCVTPATSVPCWRPINGPFANPLPAYRNLTVSVENGNDKIIIMDKMKNATFGCCNLSVGYQYEKSFRVHYLAWTEKRVLSVRGHVNLSEVSTTRDTSYKQQVNPKSKQKNRQKYCSLSIIPPSCCSKKIQTEISAILWSFLWNTSLRRRRTYLAEEGDGKVREGGANKHSWTCHVTGRRRDLLASAVVNSLKVCKNNQNRIE